MVEAWSMGTAYSALFLLCVSITLGPLNLVSGRSNPVHSAVRRDLGITAGVTGIIHTVLGLQVHMGGELARYFLLPPTLTPGAAVFVASNYLGLISAVVLGVLIAISNNRSIRILGLNRWKQIQRTAYAAIAAAIAHGLLYQMLEGRAWILIALVAVVAAGVVLLQFAGARVNRERRNEENRRSENAEA